MNIVLNAQWAMYQLLIRLGLRPDAVVGHSSGELLALYQEVVSPGKHALCPAPRDASKSCAQA